MSRAWFSLFALLFLGPLSRAAEGSPNVVVILADDLGYGDVQCLNPKRGKIPTPRLDALASQGMTFTDGHSGSSVCTPTRYGLLTGRYAWRTRLQQGVLDGYDTPLIAEKRLTLPGLLATKGYHTSCIGKWHLGFTIDGTGKTASIGAITKDGPTTRGFQHFFGFHHARMMKPLFEDDRCTRLVEPIDMLPTLVSEARRVIAERATSGKPFFIYLPLNSPHTPIVPSPEWQGKSGLGAYGDFVMQTDAAVGQVLDALDEAKVADRTLVIFSSDNGCSGPAADAPKLEAKGHFPSADLRGYKSDIWDGGHRVPFLLRWPGVVGAGSRSEQLVCLTDLMATCAELVGVQLPAEAGEDSISFLPVLRGGAQGKVLRQNIVHHSINGRFSIREGNWKLALCPGSGGWSKPKDGDASKQGLPEVQLYDLSKDLAEQHNLAADQPEVVARLTALLEAQVRNGRSTEGERLSNDVGEVKLK